MINNENVKEQWMPCPKLVTEYPGLTYIYTLGEIIIENKADALHQIVGTSSKCFTIYNNRHEKIFVAVQETLERKHNLKIFNYYGNEVIQVTKPYSILCVNRVLVFAPPGNFVGTVEKLMTCLKTFVVKNHTGEVILKLKTRRGSRFVHDILSNDATIGLVTQKYQETVSLEQSISATFPVAMDVGHKAVLIGACFLIGYLMR